MNAGPGGVLVEDVRVVVEIPKTNGLRVVDEKPRKPYRRFEVDVGMPKVRTARFTEVEDNGDVWEVEARIGKIQPTATVWSKPFWIGSEEDLELNLLVRVFGDNITRAIEVPVTMAIKTAHRVLDEEDNAEDVPDDDA